MDSRCISVAHHPLLTVSSAGIAALFITIQGGEELELGQTKGLSSKTVMFLVRLMNNKDVQEESRTQNKSSLTDSPAFSQ